MTTATPGPDGQPLEIEVKYRVTDPAAGERWLAETAISGFLSTGRPTRVTVVDQYLDTAAGALRAAGFVARIRRDGRSATLTVKSTAEPTGSGAIHRRLELEGPAGPELEPDAWPASAARTLLVDTSEGAPLVELVSVRQDRRKRILERNGTAVELSLDDVAALRDGAVVATFVELEVELLRGDEADLAKLDARFAADPGLEPARTSKLQSALDAVARSREADGAVVAPTPAGPRSGPTGRARTAGLARPETEAVPPKAELPKLAAAKNPGVVGDDTVAEAGRKVLRFHLARMIAREAGTRDGSDPEELHAMRVATRRQRAAWRIFGEGFRSGRTRPHRTHIREVARRLGAVRDLDVLLAGLEADRAGLPEPERGGLEPLADAWRTARDEARALLVRELDSARHRRWLDGYAEFVRSEGQAARVVEGVTPNRVRDTAPSRILAAHERVRAYEHVLRTADVATLHELRIAAKWLRYSIEFVREPLGPDSAPLIASVTALQDHLGLLHDADVAAGQGRAFVAARGSSLKAEEVAAIERYAARNEERRDALVRSVGPAWRAVAGLGFRRRLGRVLAGL